MAKKRKQHSKPGMTIPVAVIAGFAPLGIGLLGAVKRGMAGDMAGMSQEMTIRTTGYNTDTKSFHWPTFMQSYGPIVAGLVIHKAASRLGVNRALARAGVPFLRV
jgi:hypothetical protein